MTSTRTAESFAGRDSSGAAPIGINGVVFAMAAFSSGIVLAVSAAFSIGDDATDAAVFTVLAAVMIGLATPLRTRKFDARTMRPVPTLSAVVMAYLAVGVLSTIVYLSTGAIDRLDDALYESITGVSTSSLTLFEDPSVLDRGELIWRSGTQWLGGLGALALGVGLLPFLGGSPELADPRQRGSRRLSLAPRPVPALKRVAVLYLIVSGVVIVALFAVGMSFTDAVAHMMSSVSTGGFSTHAEGIAHFDSLAIELTMIVVMAGAGFSLALVWMLYRGQFHDTRRVYELRVYGLVLMLASAWVFWLQRSDPGDVDDRIVDSVFTVVSLSTTTGHRTADWGLWEPGAALMLILLMVVGGMAGSVAGGLRWFRVIGLTQFVWRELQRQLHPRTVRSVKVGDTAISEESVDRWHSQFVLMMAVVAPGAVLLAFFGSDINEAITLALGAVSTTGPALAEDGGALVSAASVSRIDRAVLMPMMLTGRVALYPAFVLISVLFFHCQRQAARLVFDRRIARRRSRS